MSDYKVPLRRRSAPCRYRNLSSDERKTICNGCGGKGGWFNPPEYNFTASCNHHDFNYWLGGTEADRKKADQQFLEAMLEDVRGYIGGSALLRPLRRLWRRGAAHRYYAAVRLFGKKFFYFTDKKLEGSLSGRLLEKTRWGRLEKLMRVHGFKEASDKTAWEK